MDERFMRDFFHMPAVDVRTLKLNELAATLACLNKANEAGLFDAYKIRQAAEKLIAELFP
jgi:hypothetical protein